MTALPDDPQAALFIRGDLTPLDLVVLINRICHDEIAEPWDEGSEWMALRIRAAIRKEPPPEHPAGRVVRR